MKREIFKILSLKTHPSRRSQAMVEFALIMPLLLLLVYGLLEVGILVFQYASVVTASRQAARYGAASGLVSSASQYRNCAGIVAAAQRVDFLNSIDDGNITISYYSNNGALLETIQGDSCHTGPTVPSGGEVEVTVTADFTPLSGLVPINPITLTSESSRTILGSVAVAGATVGSSLAPPTMSKVFSPNSIPVGGVSTLTFGLSNPNQVTTLTGVNFTDNFPTGMVVADPPGVTTSGCGTPTFHAVAGENWVALSDASIFPAATCVVTVKITINVPGYFQNQTEPSSNEGGTGDIVYDQITSVSPPVITKGFGPSSIKVNGTSVMVFTILNPSSNTAALTGVGFTDSFPSGMQVAATPAADTSGCGAPVFAPTAGATSLVFSDGTIEVGITCTINVTVTGTSGGEKTNTTAAVTSTNGGPGNSASSTLTVIAPLTISKSFSPTTIAINGTSTLTFSITNPNGSIPLTGVAFNDPLPSGVQVASPTNAGTANCGSPTFSPGAGATNLSFSGGTIGTSACTVTVNVTTTTGGAKINTSSVVTSTDSDPGNQATATLTVISPPYISKAFLPVTVPINGVSKLTFTITNPPENSIALTGIAFSDSLPAGLKVAATPTASTSGCGTPTFSPAANATTLTFTNGTISAGGTCVVNVNVTPTTSGDKLNTSGSVTSINGGTGNTASATLAVTTGLAINKSFSPDAIAVNSTSTLTFTIINPNASAARTNVSFTDNLPAGLQVSATPNVVKSGCGAPTFAPVAGATTLTFSGGTIAANSSCTASVSITATTGGSKPNTTSAVTSAEEGTGNSASATLSVASPPTISKSFSPSTVLINAASTLTFTLTNPAQNTTVLTGVAFSDTFPTGVKVASPTNATTSNCGSPTFAPVANATSISFSGGAIPVSGTCTVSVSVISVSEGSKLNTSGAVTSTNGGTGLTASATLSVNPNAPGISKVFGGTTMPQNGTTTLTFTISNPNPSSSLTGVAFTDNYPTGMTSTDTPTTTCGGSFTGSTTSQLVFSGGTIAGGGTCTIRITVTAANYGYLTNTSSVVTSTNGGTGNTASASIKVVAPPVISKVFSSDEVALAATTTLTFTITNPVVNPIPLTGIGFVDHLPAGLPVSTPPNVVISGCGSPTFTPTPGSNLLTFTGGTIATGGTCTVSVNLTATIEGIKTNISDAVTSTNGGTGNTASASIKVNAAPPAVSPPSISKSFAPATISKGSTSILTFVITNPNSDNVLAGIAFTDALPSGLQVANPPNASTSGCGTPSFTPLAGDLMISLSDGLIARGAVCVVRVDVLALTTGSKVNTSSSVSSSNGGTGLPAIATLTVTIKCDASTVTHGFITTPGSTMIMSVTNNTGIPLSIFKLYVRWNSLNGHQGSSDKTLKLTQIQLASQTQVISPQNAGPDYTFLPSPEWILPINTSIITFTFHQAYDNEEGEHIMLYFSTAGCENFSPMVAP
jgi:large repetitive protein